MQSSNDRLMSWLETPDGYAFLRECANKTIKDKERLITPKDSIHWDTTRSHREKLDDLASELYLFIADNEKAQLKLKEFILQGKTWSAVNAVKAMYVNHLKDLRRGSQGDFMSNLYRRIQVLLSRDEGFEVVTGKEGSYYAAVKNKGIPQAAGDIFQEGNLESWPGCPEKSGRDVKEQDLIAWARFFWGLVRDAAGQDCLVPIRGFVYYLVVKKCVQDTSAQFTSSTQTDDDGRTSDLLENHGDISPGMGISSEKLEELALDLVSCWDHSQARAFCMRWDDRLGLAEIARELGYSGPSGASYILKEAARIFTERISAWPGLYGEELDEAARKEFLEYVFSFCKSKDYDRT